MKSKIQGKSVKELTRKFNDKGGNGKGGKGEAADLPADQTAMVPSSGDGEFALLMDEVRFAQLQRVATMYATSALVPAHFRGKVADTAIVIQMAMRLRIDPWMALQHVFVVHGRPGLSGQLALALVNAGGPFQGGLQFRVQRDESGRIQSCQAFGIHRITGELVDGPAITMEMVKAEGWDRPKKMRDGGGEIVSKWKTLPDLMFRYRAASYLARTVCPEVLMGLQTVEEIEDVAEPRTIEATLVPMPEDQERDVPDLTSLSSPQMPQDEPAPETQADPPAEPAEAKQAPSEPAQDPARDEDGVFPPGFAEMRVYALDNLRMPMRSWGGLLKQSQIMENDKRTHTPSRLAVLQGLIEEYEQAGDVTEL